MVHLYFLIGFRNRMLVLTNWLWAWLTYGRGARVIIGPRLASTEAAGDPGTGLHRAGYVCGESGAMAPVDSLEEKH